jgi:hypothetical protein
VLRIFMVKLRIKTNKTVFKHYQTTRHFSTKDHDLSQQVGCCSPKILIHIQNILNSYFTIYWPSWFTFVIFMTFLAHVRGGGGGSFHEFFFPNTHLPFIHISSHAISNYITYSAEKLFLNT